MDLGEHYPCLNVRDLEASIEFYLKLDFEIVADHRKEGWAVLQHNRTALSLYQGHIERNLINFRGGNIEEIAQELEARGLALIKPAQVHPDGSWFAEVADPDGNRIFFNTSPDEREQYTRTGKLID
ncbi:MAG: VOC family protein [Myxococcota bacterium]